MNHEIISLRIYLLRRNVGVYMVDCIGDDL